MDLLAIVAHPDDADIFIGGTLAKHATRGDNVTIAYMTRGEFGGASDTTQEDVAAVREKEALAAAETLGADATFLDFKDGRITYSLENRELIVDSIREHQPDYVITHYGDDMHPDHQATSKLVTDAYYMSSLPLAETEHDPWEPENVFYFGKPTSSFDPDLVVDISGYEETKEKAILQHESQVEWLDEHGGIDAEFDGLIDGVRAEAKKLGKTHGVKYAEGFTTFHQSSSEYLDS
ncbi:GlcNAc-PI de-N-acetylase [Haloprofundus marisrubri]|uniref:GlcNAc-PI de-N-acetylase n=1 Tax=Haloprofundus marisrubri TaxID=1514971 RepID=A0A0W1RE94_9EURY|nr:PIG-L family deacetylase [Haloprofundus marisrubri]KTG11462.1 GlcNAc-PI de-N-acetylase [Haloprofundus marisrubri]